MAKSSAGCLSNTLHSSFEGCFKRLLWDISVSLLSHKEILPGNPLHTEWNDGVKNDGDSSRTLTAKPHQVLWAALPGAPCARGSTEPSSQPCSSLLLLPSRLPCSHSTHLRQLFHAKDTPLLPREREVRTKVQSLSNKCWSVEQHSPSALREQLA